MIRNPWNERAAALGARAMDPSRPWYRYGLELVRGLGPPTAGLRALDVGCGVGEFTRLLVASGWSAEGLDGNEQQVLRMQAEGLRARAADLERGLPFADGSVSLVSALEVIEHVALAESLLGEFERVLEPGGHLVVSTPNFAFLNNRLHYLRGRPPLNEGIHLRFFTPRTLESALRAAGFEVAARNSYGVVPLASTVTTRVLGQGPILCRVPAPLEGLFAYGLVWLARKVPGARP